MKNFLTLLLFSSICLYGISSFAQSQVIPGEIAVRWNANAEADLAGYNLYIGDKSGIYNDVVDVKNVTTFKVRGLIDGIKYFIVVTAYDTSGNESVFSLEINAIAHDFDSPNMPTGLIQIFANVVNIITNGVEFAESVIIKQN